MFPTPSQVLRQREGLLADTPFPLLVHALMVEERTCTLELKVRQREKRILFEDGSPVACQSNLLHETLGKYLVEKGRLTEADYQKSLAESVSTGMQMGGLLVQKGLISPFDLYKQLQANLAHKLLDCFRWVDAKYRLIADAETPDASVRTNPAQLILTGVEGVMPFDAVATHFTFTDERRFGQMPGVESGPKLSSKDARLLQQLRQRPTFNELQERTGFDTETVLRRLYALCLLGVAGFVEDADAKAAELSARAAPVPVAPPPEPVAPEPVAARGTPFSDEDVAARDALVTAFLAHRSKDPFALLEVPEDVQPLPLRRAFLAWAERYSPLRFQTPELKEKAEALLAASAKAYGVLSDAEQNLLWRKRRAAHREKERATTSRPSTAEQFRIRTDLLDATTQFDEARRRLAAKHYAGAFEYFEYACDIEPKPLHHAWRAWARYLMKPEAHGRLALQELQEVVRQEPGLEDGWGFLGEVAQGEGQWALAEDSFRKAFKLNPKNRRYVELIQEIARRR
ncbi:DUF4388 domain-containing protein [Myxococcus llanfairpwllgwyngyllgogerychwyrndrobwllllantysiliogogogochensis]|uniref:DUF4388 domain-containing protein n=1 Tax=Myxococcus llanfairpwllgwyngyllgogerychwyrndrobwllllantysiliogogogochensis TaxID=2590453 RepID=A0A540WY32_9BACT|nr:DUF4388 domain-containing protein [Myxococcus llanfairpwllgwyngyllgogerychwyrndrobwllllantysiliogogogochensis]TQF13850.1 DUF4388 domain-containing protein [Myxococcus llanfairpwllgwyngyllgogerychwyrndrobwllllantysiliogogogochensis]